MSDLVGLNQEDENMFRRAQEMLNKVRDTFINASQLAQEVTSLRVEVQTMRGDLEMLRSQNTAADETINNLRTQRNQVQLDLNNTLVDLDRMTTDRDYWRKQANEASDCLNTSINELACVKSTKESVDIELMLAQDEVKKLSEQLSTIRNALGMTPAPTVEPVRVEITEQPKEEPKIPMNYDPSGLNDHGPDYSSDDPNRNPDGTFRSSYRW